MVRRFRLRFHKVWLSLLLIAGGCAATAGHLGGPFSPGAPQVTQSSPGASESPNPNSLTTATPAAPGSASPDISKPASPGSAQSASSAGSAGPGSSSRESAAGNNIVSVDLLVSELEAEGLLDAESKAQLTADLCRTPPHLWEGIVAAFRASMQLRKQKSDQGQLQSSDVFIEDKDVRPAAGHTSTGSLPPQDSRASSQTGLTSVVQGAIPDDRARLPRLASMDRFSDIRKEQASSQMDTQVLSEPEARPDSPIASQIARSLPARPSPPGGQETKSDAFKSPSPSSEKAAGTWDYWVTRAVRDLEDQQTRSTREEIQLRLLRLALIRREGALEPIPGLSPSLQDFWGQTLFGLLLLEDTQLHSDQQLRLVEARRHLENGIRRLAEECPLEVTGLAFVTSVQSWGVYDAFEQYEFLPGQKVLLYAEIENLASESTAKGYRTAWRSSYQILDATGKQIASYEYAPNEEYCRRPRRDFFIGCELSFPTDAPPGRYTLRLTVVDLIKQRVGQGTVDFTLRSRQAK